MPHKLIFSTSHMKVHVGRKLACYDVKLLKPVYWLMLHTVQAITDQSSESRARVSLTCTRV